MTSVPATDDATSADGDGSVPIGKRRSTLARVVYGWSAMAACPQPRDRFQCEVWRAQN
jgi:hypothetical protein